VDKPSAALEALIASLDRAMLDSLKDLPSDLYAKRDWVIDVKLISDLDIGRGTGFAKLLNSIFAPALMIWQRDQPTNTMSE
jgi:hypothetical protein